LIILDINVISEPVRAAPNVAVVSWLDSQDVTSTDTTTTTLAELLLGIEVLPKGRRKSELSEKMRSFVAQYLDRRVLAFDEPAARLYPLIVAHARLRGQTIAVSDGQIAAVAALRGFSVATRDKAPFIAAGVPVIDPWQHITR